MNYLELLLSVDYKTYYYVSIIALLFTVWFFIRSLKTVDGLQTRQNTMYIHPEVQSAKKRADLYLFLIGLSVAVMLSTGLVGLVGQYTRFFE